MQPESSAGASKALVEGLRFSDLARHSLLVVAVAMAGPALVLYNDVRWKTDFHVPGDHSLRL
jgi:hypothetical protein